MKKSKLFHLVLVVSFGALAQNALAISHTCPGTNEITVKNDNWVILGPEAGVFVVSEPVPRPGLNIRQVKFLGASGHIIANYRVSDLFCRYHIYASNYRSFYITLFANQAEKCFQTNSINWGVQEGNLFCQSEVNPLVCDFTTGSSCS